METAQDRLIFAVKFATLDLGTLGEGDLIILRDELGSFGGSLKHTGGILAISLKPPSLRDYTLKDLEALQKEVKQTLDGVVDSKGEGAKTRNSIPIQANLTLVSAPGSSNRSIPITTGTARDMFLLVLWLLLGQESTDRIMRCADIGCSRLFYRIRKQRFCSEKCAMRVFMRNKRNKDKGKKRISKKTRKAPNKQEIQRNGR